jgi:ADP-heptose:LPS heptosyltransferase
MQKMSEARGIFKKVAYSLLSPAIFKTLVNVLRRSGWLHRGGFPAANASRILVALPHNSLGDLVLTVPLLEYLHRLWPAASIDVVVGDRMTSLFEEIPFIDKVIGYAPPSSGPPVARYQGTLELLSLARRENLTDSYGIAIDPRWDSDGYGYLARVLLYLSDAEMRVGYSGLVDGNEPSLDGFLTHVATGGKGEHELLRKLRLLQRAGLTRETIDEDVVLQTSATMISLGKNRETTAHRILEEAGIAPGKPYAILSPSATNPRRIWPIERLATVACELHSRYGFRFLVAGGAGDSLLAAQLAALQPEAIVSIAGKTDVPGLVTLFAGASLFVGNDSGPGHVSGLLGTNTVVASPFPLSCAEDHINAPNRFRPCGPRVRVVQPQRPLAPCEPTCSAQRAHCICQITAEEMLSACEDLLRMTKDSL